MKAGATQTLFFFREVRRVVNQRRRFRKLRRVSRVTTQRASPNLPAPLSLNVLVRPNPPQPITLNARGPDQVLVFEMSQYVARATGMATKALDVAKTRVLPPAVEWYNATMAKNAQYVVKDPEAVDKLGKQLIYSNMAKLPAAVEAAQGEIKVVQQKWTNRMDLPMTEVRSPGAKCRVSSRAPSSRVVRLEFSSREVLAASRDARKSHPRLTYSLSLTAGWHRRSLLRGGVRVVLRRGNHRPRREPDRLLSAPPDRANARKYLSDRALPRDDARALPVCREGA